ncbi:hypothetical protein EC988_003954 [Linderina pennispora]|nr:hypothetical protein EC988_003954 [Linderina pennispora]
MLPSVKELLVLSDRTMLGTSPPPQQQHPVPPNMLPALSAPPHVPRVSSPPTPEMSTANSKFYSVPVKGMAASITLVPVCQKQRPGRKADSSSRYTSSPGARNYRCGMQSCAASFKRPEHLKRHMLTHTQIRPFKCTAGGCGKRFSRRDNYITHCKKHETSESASEGSSGKRSRYSTESVQSSVGNTPRSSPEPRPSSIFSLLNNETEHETHSGGVTISKHTSNNGAITTASDATPWAADGQSASQPSPQSSASHTASRQQRSPATPSLPPLELLAYASSRTETVRPSTPGQPVHLPPIAHFSSPSPTSPQSSPAATHRVETSVVTVQGSTQEPMVTTTSTTIVGGDPAKPFMCSLCNARFGRLEHVKRHHMVHTNERPFSCPTCKKTFARKDNMIQHVRAHERKKAPSTL